jgi:uncharacterized protein
MRLFILAAGLLAGLLGVAFAQGNILPANPMSRLVTVLSDGLSEPSNPALQALSDISIALDKDSDVRVLSMNGYGGPANVRDLIQLRGTDFAILNSDIFSYLDLTGPIPEARKKIKMVAPLVHQRVLLFARRNINALEGLRGKKIGILANHPSRGVTAKTIFGLLKIDVALEELEGKAAAKKAQDLDAVLLYESDVAGFQAFGAAASAFHLLPIPVPAASPLAAAYRSKKLGKGALPGFDADGVETVEVVSILAAFDWAPKQGRYPDAITFVDRVYNIAPKIWARNPHSPFSKTDIRMSVPGWKYFGPAEVLAKAAPAAPVKDESASLTMAAAEPAAAGAADIGGGGPLRIIAVNRAPLLNPQSKDGGIVMKLLTGALEAAGLQTTVQWADSEKALHDTLFAGKKADIGLFLPTPHCDTPANQSVLEAEVCDQAALSEPLMQAVIAVFAPLEAHPNAGAGAMAAQTMCVPENQTVPEGALDEVPGSKGGNFKIVRPKSLVNCLVALQHGETGAMIAIEPEVRFALEKLTSQKNFQISQRPGITVGLHAAVSKDNPKQAELLAAINSAVEKFKNTEAYSAIMSSHISDLTGMTVK